jgi:hypothetical protein
MLLLGFSISHILLRITGPGAMFLLQGPNVVGDMGSESDGRNQPIISSTYPARWIRNVNSPHTTTSIDNTQRNMHAVTFHRCKITVHDMNVIQTNCSGSGCDLQGLVKPDGTTISTCCCNQMHSLTNLGLAINVHIVIPSGDTIAVTNHMSRTAMNVYMLTDPIRSGTTQRRVQSQIHHIYNSFSRVLEEVNDNGGFSATLWMKRGRSIDRSIQVDNTNGYNRQPPAYNVSSDLVYHLVQFVPTTPTLVDWKEVYDMKFDTGRFDLAE